MPAPPSDVHILVVDDNSLLRHALRVFLESQGGLRVCGEAADGAEAVQKVSELKPALIVMDLSMPNMNGLEASVVIKQVMPEARIIVFTLYPDIVSQVTARAAGVERVVSKSEGATGLLQAIQRCLADDRALH
jgi:DNA-binding NarL/FixJ family response regulator